MRLCLNLKQVVCLNFVLYTLSFYDFYFKNILKERGRSCNHKTYFSTRELFCGFILIKLNALKFEEIGVHFWIVKTRFFSIYRPLKHSTFQLWSYSPKMKNNKVNKGKHNWGKNTMGSAEEAVKLTFFFFKKKTSGRLSEEYSWNYICSNKPI